MTEKLKTLLHEQATTPDFAPVDLGAITATGDRRVRRRRVSAVAAGLAAAVVVTTVAVSTAGPGDDDAVDPAGPYAEARVSWAEGSVIHYGDTTIDVGVAIEAFVYTGSGFVLVSRDEVWSVDGSGTRRVGTMPYGDRQLFVDEDDGLAGWLEGDGREAAMVFLDQRAHRTFRVGERVQAPIAVDGRTAYWMDDKNLVAGDLDSGVTRVVRSDKSILPFGAAEDGVLAVTNLSSQAVVSRPDADDLSIKTRSGFLYDLSPDARWLTVVGEHPEVYDVRTGERISIDIGDRPVGMSYGWMGSDVLLVATASSGRPQATAEILTCAVPAGSCTSAADLGPYAEFEDGEMRLPISLPIFDETSNSATASSTDTATALPED